MSKSNIQQTADILFKQPNNKTITKDHEPRRSYENEEWIILQRSVKFYCGDV